MLSTHAVLLSVIFSLPGGADAGSLPGALAREQMQKLKPLHGNWRGQGWISFGPSQRHVFVQTERIEPRLDGLLLTIEGVGKAPPADGGKDEVAHAAFAVVSFDEATNTYRFKSWRADGKALDVEAKVRPNELEWGYQDPRAGTIRFVLRVVGTKWTEVGERSGDGGKTWHKFFEMALERQP